MRSRFSRSHALTRKALEKDSRAPPSCGGLVAHRALGSLCARAVPSDRQALTARFLAMRVAPPFRRARCSPRAWFALRASGSKRSPSPHRALFGDARGAAIPPGPPLTARLIRFAREWFKAIAKP
ncbi:MAG TPA: hypothetical protein QF665_03630, partial [Alphaproteobacteria bacterium]|nr:hypothetical protein [Alphaproteobacteria bacterium]